MPLTSRAVKSSTTRLAGRLHMKGYPENMRGRVIRLEGVAQIGRQRARPACRHL